MEFKKGCGWRACYDEEKNLYTAQWAGLGSYHLYEITKEIYDQIEDGADERDVYQLIKDGRHLYMDVNDRCGPPYTIIFDHDYQELCPWANVISSGDIWPDDLVDEAVEVFASEKNNREQRRRRREEREMKEKNS